RAGAQFGHLRPGQRARHPDGARRGRAPGLPRVRAAVAAERGLHRRRRGARRRVVDLPEAGPDPAGAQPASPPGGGRSRALLERPRVARAREPPVARVPSLAGWRAVAPGSRRGDVAVVLVLPRDAPHLEPHDGAPGQHRRLWGTGRRLPLLPHPSRHRRLDRGDDWTALVAHGCAQWRRRRGRLPGVRGSAASLAHAIAGAPAGRGVAVRQAASAARTRVASVSSAAAAMSLTRSHSRVVWMSRIPVPRFTTSKPRRLSTLASHPPPITAEPSGRPTRSAAARRSWSTAASSGTRMGWYIRSIANSTLAPGWRAAASSRQPR